MLQISSLYSFIIQNCFMIFEQKPFTILSSAKSDIFLTIWRTILFLKQIIQQYLGIYYAIILTVLKSVCGYHYQLNCFCAICCRYKCTNFVSQFDIIVLINPKRFYRILYLQQFYYLHYPSLLDNMFHYCLLFELQFYLLHL